MTAVDLSERFETAAESPATETTAIPKETSVIPAILQDLSTDAKTLLGRLLSPYLFPSSSTMNIPTSPAAKEDAIRRCLRGRDDNLVDLWLLRELALSSGGLMTPELRKVAWPKLAGCHAALESTTNHSLVTPSAASLAALAFGVSRATWNVEECRQALRDYQRRLDQEMIFCEPTAVNEISCTKTVRFTTLDDDSIIFASPKTPKHLFHGVDAANHDSDSLQPVSTPPETIHSSPADSDSTSSDNEWSVIMDETKLAVNDGGTPHQEQDDNAAYASTMTNGRQPASMAEQDYLFKIIRQVLCTAPADDKNDWYYYQVNQDQYHYTTSLVDLAALVWIHVDSPSLTTLVLKQLVTSQLRDALRGMDHDAEGMLVKNNLMPLLARFYPKFYSLVHENERFGSAAVEMARPFMNGCWLSGLDLPVAARLLDVVLVSHAMFPMYAGAALIAEHGQELLKGSGDTDAADKRLEDDTTHDVQLSALVKTGLNGMAATESVIQRALNCMKLLPPKDLTKLVIAQSASNVQISAMLSSVSIISEPPTWTKLSLAPTDYAFVDTLKSALESENGQDVVADAKDDFNSTIKNILRNEYPLAKVAIGMPARGNPSRKGLSIMLYAVMAFGLLVVLLSIKFSITSTSHPSIFEPTASQMDHGSHIVPTALPWLNDTVGFMAIPPMYELGLPPVGFCWAKQISFREIVGKPAPAIATEPTVEMAPVASKELAVILAKSREHPLLNQLHLKRKAIVTAISKLLKMLTTSQLLDRRTDMALIHVKCKELPGDLKEDLRELWTWAKPTDDDAWMEYI